MTYYHVSSLIKEGQILKRNTKNNFDYCCYVSSCDVTSYEEFIECYNNLCLSRVYEYSGRTAAKWMCEAIFEHVRQKEFPDKPSRIWGIYLSDSYEEAKKFLDEERKPWVDEYGNTRISYIYQVDILDGQKVHCFDMDLYTKADNKLQADPQNESAYHDAFVIAREYWNGSNNVGQREYIVDDVITVGKKV